MKHGGPVDHHHWGRDGRDDNGHTNESLEMQMYGFDRTMAPEGKGVIKVELVSRYSYGKKLYADRPKYDEEKQRVAQQVIDLLENRFAGIKGQIEMMTCLP